MNLKRKKSTSSSDEDKKVQPPSASDTATAGPSFTVQTMVPDSETEDDGYHKDDIGKFFGLATTMPVDKKNIFSKIAGHLRKTMILRQMPNISRVNAITSGWTPIHHGWLIQGDSKVLLVNIVCCFRRQQVWWEVVGVLSASGPSLSTRTCTIIVKHTCRPRNTRLQWSLQNRSWRPFQWITTSPVFTKIKRSKQKSVVLSCFLHHFFRHTWFTSQSRAATTCLQIQKGKKGIQFLKKENLWGKKGHFLKVIMESSQKNDIFLSIKPE